MLKIRLLGQFDCQLNGAEAPIASRQAQALLAFLALHSGKPQRREQLAGLIWPESVEENARTYLRQALWRLRKAVGDSYFRSDRMTISFNSDSDYWLDTAVLTTEPAGGWTADSLITAVSVYEGDLLPGFYDDWITLERERLQAIYSRRMDALLKSLLEAARWPDILTWGERWIAMGSAPEPAYRALMTAHAARADLTSMTAVYRRCVEALEAELGVEPSAETRALFERLRQGQQTATTPPVGQPKPVSPPPFFDSVETVKRQETSFIGRQRELAHLNETLKAAVGGTGQVVFITGEAGRGKTALLQEFASQAQEAYPSLIVASGACPVYTPVCAPYGLFREVLKMLTGDVEAAWSAGTISQPQAQRLWQLLPDVLENIMQHSPHLIDSLISAEGLITRARSAGVEPQQIEKLQAIIGRSSNDSTRLSEQGALFAEFADLLITLCQQQPVLIILDDLHWADPSSIGLLGHLGHRLAEGALLVVGAYRPEEIFPTRATDKHPLEPVLSEYKRRYGQTTLSLDETETGDGRQFIDTLLDHEANALDDAFRQALTRHTDGHPLFTIELLRELKAKGTLQKDEAGQWVLAPDFDWDVVPPRVEGVIETRLSHLDQELRQWLELAAVEGKVFTAEVIARIAGIEERIVVQRLSRELDRQHRLVTAQGITQVGGKRQSLYQFRHHLFQKYLYDQLDTIERSYLHQQVGETLEQLFEQRTEPIADQLAYHFQTARIPLKTIRYLKQAGEFAARLYALEDAINFYQQALEHVNQLEANSLPAAELNDLYLKLGRTLEHNGEASRAVAVYEAMEQQGRSINNPSLILKALVALGTQYAIPTAFHNPQKSLAISEEALLLARQTGDRTAEVQTLWNLMTAYEYNNQMAKAIEYGEKSLALARQLDDRSQLAFTLSDLAGAYWVSGQISHAKTLFPEALTIWREFDNQPMQADVLFSYSLASMFGGDYDQAIALSDEAWEISCSIGNKWGLALSRSRIGFVHRARGEPGRGTAAMEESFREGQARGLPIPQSVTGAELAFDYAFLGATEKGLAIAKIALEVANEHTPSHRPFILAAEAQNHLVKGDLAQAELAVQQAYADPYWQAFSVYCLAPVLVDGRLALEQGEYERALRIAEGLLARLQAYDARAYLPDLLDLLGQILINLGRPDEGRTRLLEARQVAESLNARASLWSILFHLSQIEANPDTAHTLRQQATEIVQYIADNAGDPALAASFLALPKVSAVISTRSLDL